MTRRASAYILEPTCDSRPRRRFASPGSGARKHGGALARRLALGLGFVGGTLGAVACGDDSAAGDEPSGTEDTGTEGTGPGEVESGPDQEETGPDGGETSPDGAASCGNGIQEEGEACDTGANNGIPGMSDCLSDCTLQRCGDGYLGASEQCDDANLNGSETKSDCMSNCRETRCGDGFVGKTEACDEGDGNSDQGICSSMCVLISCGDGEVDPGEDCDDAGESATCNENCTTRSCGDEIINAAAGEQCDDGNASNTDACLNSCRKASCGDEYLWAGKEDCDLGEASNGQEGFYDCTSMCRENECGDGYRGTDEDCDDGNDVDADGCTSNCRLGVSSVAVGYSHVCAIFGAGRLRCWGGNTAGQLGINDLDPVGNDFRSIIDVGDVDVGGPVRQVVVGAFHTCALLESGGVRCWGYASDSADHEVFAVLGYGRPGGVGGGAPGRTILEAGDLDLGDGNVVEIRAGVVHTCARFDNGDLRCWGIGNFFTQDDSGGYLGYGSGASIGDDETPGSLHSPTATGVVKFALGIAHTCALFDDGGVRCWGANAHGTLGLGTPGGSYGDGMGETPANLNAIPLTLPEEAATVVQVASSFSHSCARFDTGGVRCWGLAQALGYGTDDDQGDEAREMPPLNGAATDIYGNLSFYAATDLELSTLGGCITTESRGVRCWGESLYGELGYPGIERIATDPHGLPTSGLTSVGLVDVGGPVHDLVQGPGFGVFGYIPSPTCAVMKNGDLRCWGPNMNGQLGLNLSSDETNGGAMAIGDDETPASVGPVPVYYDE